MSEVQCGISGQMQSSSNLHALLATKQYGLSVQKVMMTFCIHMLHTNEIKVLRVIVNFTQFQRFKRDLYL